MNLAINPTALLPGAAPPGGRPENTALDFDKPAQVKTLESANKSRIKIQTKRRPPSRQARQISAITSSNATPSLPTPTPAPAENSHDIPQVPTFNDRVPQPSSDLLGNTDQLAESSAFPGLISQSSVADEKQKDKLTDDPLSSIKSKTAVISDDGPFGGPITNTSQNKLVVASNTDDDISIAADEKQKDKLTDDPLSSIKSKTAVASDEDLFEGPITNSSKSKPAVISDTDDDIFGPSSKSKLSSKPASAMVNRDDDIFSSKSVKSAENSNNKSVIKVNNDDGDIVSTKTDTKKPTDFDKILDSPATTKAEEKSGNTEKKTKNNDQKDIFADSSLFKEKELQEAKPQKVDTGTDTHDMGADASKELVETDEYAQYNQGSEPSPGNSVGRKTSSVSRNMSQISGDDMDGEGQLIDGYLRPVQVSTSGFIPPEVEIMEGQGILFRWMEIGSRLEVVQVIHDGDKLRPVIGGFESKDPDCKDREGNYVQKFTLEGEYKFALLSVRCTPLNVVVKRRLPLRAILTDRGFEPRIVTIDQGNSIEWTWRQCTVPHSVQEVQYIPDRGCFLKNIDQDNANNVVRTVTGNYLKKFPRPGLYFYQTESSELDRVHLCAVRVQSSTREYKIEISDRSFNPSVLLIETGDRVWWYWDKYKCKKLHCVYEIMAPSLDQDDDEPYKPVEKGFRWTAPSKQGLLSYVFNEPGVYYFSDQNFQEAAEYIGTIIVKPKPKEHFVRLTESGFEPDIAQIKTGERLWFRWDSQVCRNRNQLVLVKETEKCVNPSSSPNRPETPDDDEKFQYPDEEALKLCTDVGYASVFMRNTGVYHYRISRAPDSFSTCSVIVNPGEKNHTIHLTDSGPEQKVIMSVRPHDRVWWVWQSTKKQHNVIQVSHQGDPIDGGFCSGMLRDSPSAFVHTFTNPGVFYYKSQNLPKIFGAVVVTTQPIVHTVSIGTEIKPDPVEVKLYDIVCWLLNRPRTDDVAEIETTDQVMGGQMQSRQITPRRCLNRAISRTGVLHYFSKSFRKQKKSSDNFMDDVRFSSIICDERYDNTVVRVDNEGFHPHFVYVKKGESVRWTWIGTDQEHNIIHVTAPDSKEPLNVVSGAKSFNSGKQVKNNSFLYTFDVTGSYSVASQGAPGYCCTVFVIDSAQKVETPTIPGTSMNGGTVDRYQTVQLECETPGVKIFYTIDGTPPELHIDSARLYKSEKGVKLKETGLCFIRAMAVKEGMLNSEIFTSKRFWVLSKETDRASETTSESGEERLKAKPTPAKNENWDWWSCAPTIKACFTDPGVMEVFWEEPNAIQKKLIKGYMIFLNGVSYCEMFPPTNNSLSICGLAGNRLYEVSVEVYAVQKKQNPQTSNKLMMKCPLMTKEGGPIVSLERSDKPDALVVVWMSIDTKEYPIKGYLVFLNEQQCGSMLVPDQDKNRCKVFIGGCELHKQHKIYVVALPRDNIDDARMSNIIEVTLPLDFSQLQLPDELDRIGDEELYQEYLAVQEGAGYLPEMDAKLNQLEISEVQRSTPGGRNVGSRRYKDRRGYTQQVVEVEDPRYRGVRPLKKQSNFHSKHFSQVEKSESSEKSKTSHGSMVTGKGNATPHGSAYPDAASPVPPAYEHGQPDHGSRLPQPPTQERPKTRNHFKGMSLADQIAQRRRVQDQAIPLEIDYTPAGQRANERDDYGSYSPAPHRLSSDYGQSHMSQTMNRGMTNQSRSYTSPSLMRHPSHQSHMSDKLPINRSLSQPSQMSANAQMNSSLTESQVYESPSLNRRFSQQVQGEDPYGYPPPNPQMSSPQIEDNIYGTDVSVTQKPATVDWNQQRRLDHISFKMAGKIATLKPPKIDIRIQRYKYPVSFRMVAKAVKNFITQEKIMMMGIAPGHMKKKYNFDWSRFRTWVKCTNAFEAQKNAQKVYELKAPSMKSLERTNEFVLNQDNPNENNLQQNFLEQQMDPDLYPEHHQGHYQRHWNDITNTVEKSLSFETVRPQRRQKYGQYLDVHPRKSYHTRSFDGVSPERIKRSPRYETRRDDYPRVGRSRSREERHSRSSRYDQHSRSRSRSHSYESPDSGRMHYSYGYHSYDGHSPRKKFSKDEFERHSGDHGFYESGSDYDEEYCDYEDYGEGSSDDYERDVSPSYRGRSREPYHQQNRHQPHHQREKRDQYGSPIRSGRYDRFQDSSPEDKNRRYKNQRGFNTDFGVYGDKGSMRPPFLTMKEFNEMESHKKRKEKRKGRKQKERSPDRNYMMENEDPGLKTLGTYGKMFRGELLKDIVVEGDQSVMTDDNYEKSTQTPPGRRKIKTLRDSYDSEDLRQSRVAYHGKSPGGRRDVSESQSESETASDSDTESYSESETESEASRISHDGSVVVVSMNKSRSGGTKMMRSSPRDTPREEVTALRSSGRGYVPLDRSEKLVKSDYSPRPPTEYSKSGRGTRAIIEVEDEAAEDFDASRTLQSVTVAADRKHRRRIVQEGEYVYNEIRKEDDIGVPCPSVRLTSLGKTGVCVEWSVGVVNEDFEVQQFIVNIVGRGFNTREINSHISFECNLVDLKGQSVRGTQHCWTLDGNRQKINIRGLYGGETYRIFVVANYGMKNSEGKAYEVQHTSSVIYYTTIGPPTPPMLRVVGVNFYRAKLEWDPPRMQRGLELLGYKVYVNNKPLIRGLLREDKRQMVIDDLIPGKTIGVYVKAILKQSEIESDPSREVHITCPRRPPPPHIEQQPLYKHGAVMIAWDKPSGVRRNANEESISKYEIYLNDKLYGEKTANAASDRQGYQFIINGLNPEQSYDVQVKSVAGQKNVDQDQSHIFCMSDSEVSNTVPVMAPASPKSPELRLENMSPNGIRVTWSAPQQYGGVEISGYRLLKNGKLYGDIMGPDVYAVDITGVRLGEKVVLQLVALTNHPVGKLENAAMHSTYERDSGSESSPRRERPDVFLGEKYAGCHPGPKLTLHYTGLVKSPSDVWFEQVTGHSALVVWTKEDNVQSHFVRPDHYVVTWWRGSHEKEDVRSEETKEDHLLITGLQPSTAYTVVVEARRMDYYKIGDDQESSSKNKFILTADSDSLLLKTARPPDPPSNLAVTASTCHGLRIVWDPPVEKGVEVIAIRIDAQSINTSDPHHVSFEVRPDENQADIEPLREKTDYVIRVTAVTDEYFDRLPEKHKLKKLRTLPRDRIVGSDDSVWLPNAYTMAKTAGTEPPANLKVIESSTTAMTISWVAPIVYGSNKLTGIVVRWSDVKNTKKSDSEWYVASHLNLDPSDNRVTIQDLTPGAQYKIVVEAVVSIKTSLENTSRDSDYEKYRRTANVMSKPLYARARAPTEPPRLYVTGYTQTTAQLYWEKPPLVSVIGKDSDGKPKYLRRYLEGYKLEINDRLHSCLGPNAQSCQLTKCKPGKKYNVVLVALTCTDQGKKERKRKYKGVYRNVNPQTVDYSALLQDEENLDPSPSDPQEIVLPTNQEGYVQAMDRVFKHDEDRDNSTFGDIELKWDIQGDRSDIISHVCQYNIVWSNNEDRQVQTKVVSADIRKTLIPVTRLKSVYDLLVEPDYFTDVLPQRNQRIQIVVPGPPDAPEIFLKSVSPEEFVIEWGEPRLYGGVRVRGYQVYLNDKKVGNELSNSHRKAVIPCRPNKNYKVQLVALSDNSFYSDSSKSNALHVNTSPHSPRQVAGEEWAAGDDQDMPVKVTQVTETSIHLDWNNFLETEGVDGYRIQWSSVAQPAQREVKLSSKDSSCIINNCLPGTTHFVRLVAMDVDGQILEKSRQMTIQTSAPPDSPVVTVRACNFRYIAVQWEKPNTYGDALVTGYKVYVNGIVESILNADQLSYTFTHGKWCQEYAFQIQALTSYDKLHSKVSEPLVVVWPGCRAPALRRLPTHSSSNIRIAWDDPYLTDGVKVKHFRAVCLESDTEKEVTPSIGPIHPHTREAEFKHLKRGTYSIHLEVHLYNTGDILCSEPIHVSPAPAPDPPRVTVTVVGLDERRALERLTCDLVNKRDRLIRKVGHKLKEIGALSHPLRAERNHAVIEGAQTLSRIEEILEDCFAALDHFTGQLIAHVSWSCPQSRSETQITGYKLLIDGKQYGSPMHDGIKTVRIKLGTEEPQHKLSMLSMSDKPQATSEESNTVDLLTETFRPFSFYCYHSIHNQAAKWPSHGCCKYQDSILYERQLAKKLANQGLLRRKVPPPSCSLLDIFEGEYKPLLGSHNKQFATCIFFWTPWCLSSQKVMASFSRFAREASSEFNFIAVTCGVNATQATDRKALIHSITSNGWREDGVIWHCTSQCASAIHEATNNVWKNSTAGSSRRKDDTNESFKDLTEILGIAGVPTFLFVHPDGYIAWHGRYSAYDYASFGAFMRHTFSEVIGTPCPVFKCDLCKNDMTIDEDALEPVLQLVRESPTANLNMRFPQENRPPSPKRPDSPVSTDQNYERLFLKRKQQSPKSKKKKLTVNHRPYSASTYVQLLKSPYMQKTVPSPKVLNKLLRPQSGGARLG